MAIGDTDLILNDDSKNILIDTNFLSYRPIVEKPWQIEIALLSQNTKLNIQVFELTVALGSCANSFAFPWVVCKQMEDFAESFAFSHESFLETYVTRISGELTKRVHFTKNKKQQVEHELERMVHQAAAGVRRGKEEFTFKANEYWDKILPSTTFRMSIWGLQRLCYTGAFHAYEDFLANVCRVVSGDPEFRVISARHFDKDLDRILGTSIANSCWRDTKVNSARIIRNAIAHAGGKETKELVELKEKGIEHGIEVVEKDYPTKHNELQLMPNDVRTLFELIQTKTFEVTKAIVG